MFARVCSAESESSIIGSSLCDDTVVVVKCFFHRYEDADVGFGYVGLCGVVPDLGVIMACKFTLAIDQKPQ
jgi:hypothetical protein